MATLGVPGCSLNALWESPVSLSPNPARLCFLVLALDLSCLGLISKALGLAPSCLLWAGAPARQMWASHGHLAKVARREDTPWRPLLRAGEKWRRQASSSRAWWVSSNALRVSYRPPPTTPPQRKGEALPRGLQLGGARPRVCVGRTASQRRLVCGGEGLEWGMAFGCKISSMEKRARNTRAGHWYNMGIRLDPGAVTFLFQDFGYQPLPFLRPFPYLYNGNNNSLRLIEL